MASVSQIPWIFTGTVRENIIFGKPFDQTRYEKVLEVCDMNPDIHEFPKGDLRVIGQRGVMLSGGQRVRVSIARAVYSDADIFLLDDPLSAVDAKVGQHIFDKCICGELSGKIRILVTHQLQHLHRADEIVVLKEGSVLRRGSFSEMSQHENADHLFANYGSIETSDSKEDRKVQIITDDKEKDRSRLDLVQEDEDKAIGTVSWRLYWDYFRSGLPSVLVVCLVLFFAAAQGIVNYWLIFVVIPTLAVLFLLCRYYLMPARDLSRLEAILRSPVYAHISETMEGLEVIHSLQMEDRNVEKLYKLQNVHTRAYSLVVSTSRWVGLYADGVCAALFVTVVAVATVFLPLDSATTGFILAYVISIVRQTSVAMRYCSEVETQMVSVERVRRYTMLSAESGYERQEKPPQDWPDQEKVGIAGRTGAGKSSLVAALFRMPDPQGHVLIDGIDLGHPVGFVYKLHILL
ncbi:hypothetical protein QZH41_005914 [Actinostola sp. cb2023]|nr:hypothetical protein QZH41_005914 [Actinostola sp. cb2023]